MRSAHSYEPFHGDGEGHVGGGTEGNCRHGVQDVDVHMGEELGRWEPLIHRAYSGIGMYWYVEYDVPMKKV